jgi:ubiquinone/menaquinone biosynthesis C-methylase UbiE
MEGHPSVDNITYHPGGLMNAGDANPRLYSEFADWYPMLSSPGEYVEDARIFLDLLTSASGSPPRTLLELGSGAGNTAFHYKQVVQATLVDLSPRMLDVSQRSNPDCEHIHGDMRTLRLGRTFDAVLVHDAVQYLTIEDDLRQMLATAFAHCRPGGVALFAPDFTTETFVPATTHGGHDGDGRSMRYLAWIWDPDPSDTTYVVDFAYLFHEEGQPTRSAYDRHVQGVFPRATWMEALAQAGFEPDMRPFAHSELPVDSMFVFLGTKPIALCS